MKIKGLNVEQEFDVEPSVDEWLKSFRTSFNKRISDEDYAKLMGEVVAAYKLACDYDGAVPKLDVDEHNMVVFPKGALLHMLPVDSFDVLAEKFLSIKKYGLISLDMLKDGDDFDAEVPTMVSFHRILPNQTMNKKIEQLKKKNNLTMVKDIGIIFDVQSEGIQKLLAYDITDRENIDRKNKYYDAETDMFYAYKMKRYPKLIKTENEKKALGMLTAWGTPVSVGENFAYLPIAVPSKYIVGFVLPDKLKDNEQIISFLQENFPTATICTLSGDVIKLTNAEEHTIR